MDYRKVAREIYEQIGGKENLISAAHCATRLRLVISDNNKADKEKVENIDGVKGVFFAQGQMQIILGTGVVNKVYDEFIQIADISESSKEELKQVAASKANPLQRLIKTLGDIFVPIIPAIVASGFLMGIMEALNFMVANGFLDINTSGSIYVFAKIFSNTAYTFLPILIAFSAGKVFGANPFLSAVIGMIMIHPDLQNAWTVATEGVQATQSVWFGLYSVDMVGYQGHVIPVIISVWVLAQIEKRLHKMVPAMFDLFVTPLVSVFVTGYLTLSIIGPVFVTVENGLLDGVQWLIALPLGIGSFIMGGAYATTVVAGVHHMYTIIDLGQIAKFGMTFWLPLASAANLAQGGAALAVAIKTKDLKVKAMAVPSALSAFMGITEPAIFGVNLRFVKPFIMASIGGACGALYASVVGLGATGTGVTGIFGILLCLNQPVHYLIMMLISAGTAFVLTWLFGYKNQIKEVERENKVNVYDSTNNKINPNANANINANTSTNLNLNTNASLNPNANISRNSNMTSDAVVNKIIFSPLKGKVIPISQVKDETFASEMLGKGVGIMPASNRVVAPFDGTVTTFFETKHAIGLTNQDGLEVLIHVGIDTVNLKGEHFQAFTKEGEVVKKGELLLEFDQKGIENAGYDSTTMVIVTNTDDYKNVNCKTGQTLEEQDVMIEVC